MKAKRGTYMSIPVFVINLDRRPDRLERISEELAKLGLQFTRVQAVDGSQLDPGSAIRPVIARLYNGLKNPAKGAVGCFLSHAKVWNHIVSEGIPQALVLEDDSVPGRWEPSVLSQEISRYGVDLLRLAVGKPVDINTRKPLEANEDFIPGFKLCRQASPGTGAYIITLDGARKCLRVSSYAFPVDHFDLLYELYGLRSAVVLPSVFVASDSTSSITLGEPFQGPAVYVKFRRRLRWLTRAAAVAWLKLEKLYEGRSGETLAAAELRPPAPQ
jgi:GR25 family glycosyltransferase involved in LPS biosynthesis